MTIVNDWLRNNPQYIVMRVEDLERKINEKTWQLETETTIMHEPMFGNTYYVRGVRYGVHLTVVKQCNIAHI